MKKHTLRRTQQLPDHSATPPLEESIAAAMRDKAEAEAQYRRRQECRQEISGRRYRDETMKARFLQRLDEDIAAARRRLTLAEANLEGLLLARDGERGGGTA